MSNERHSHLCITFIFTSTIKNLVKFYLHISYNCEALFRGSFYLAPTTNFSPATGLMLLPGRPSTPPVTAAATTLELVSIPTGVGEPICGSTGPMEAVREPVGGHRFGELLTMVYAGGPAEAGFNIWKKNGFCVRIVSMIDLILVQIGAIVV